MSKCPICKSPLKVKDYCSENYVEIYEACEEGCRQYFYEEWCGSSKEYLGDTVIYGHYADSKTTNRKRSFIYKRKIARLRKAYRKGKFK